MTKMSSDLLGTAREQMTQRELADRLGVAPKTVGRWERGEVPVPAMAEAALRWHLEGSSAGLHPLSGQSTFTFIDLFAGIGGIRLGFEAAGGECVFTSEWDRFAEKTYKQNFGDHHPFAGDITKVPEHRIPDHGVLLAGFPCQPFSLAGVSKKNALGRPHGFEDLTQGTLFHDIVRIIREKQPKAFLLENVKNLRSHDRGRTFAVIEAALHELGYSFTFRVINGRHWVPQNRQRILIAGFREEVGFDLESLELPEPSMTVGDILLPEEDVDPKYILSDHLWTYLQTYAAKHRQAGNGFGYGLVTRDSPYARTLSARYHKDGSEILIDRGPGRNPRRLTPRECARLMGYPDTYQIPVSDTQAYRQFGNSVVVPMMASVAKAMAPYIADVRPIRHEQRELVLQSTVAD